MKRLLAIPLLLALGACTPSETTCSLMTSAKRVFDAEVAAGTVEANHIAPVNAAYGVGRAVCDAPPGTYDQAAIINAATDAYIAIRAATSDNAAAYQAMKPQLQQLERLLKEARK